MSPNVKNRTLFTGDNLDVMCGINSDSVDLIYLDPPFNSNRNFTVDHIVPRLKGGTDHLDNLQLLCGACNSTKGTIDQAAFVAKLKTQGIRD